MIDATMIYDTTTGESNLLITNGHTHLILNQQEADQLEFLLGTLLQQLVDKRMDIIGQNGNDGEHYESINSGCGDDLKE